MFFDLEDYATTYRSTIDPNCVNPNIPKVDNSSLECSQIISTNCVVTAKGIPYLGIGSGETVTSVIEKIKEKFKSLSFSILNLGTGIGLLKSFSGGVLSAKSIKAGNNIQLTEAIVNSLEQRSRLPLLAQGGIRRRDEELSHLES